MIISKPLLIVFVCNLLFAGVVNAANPFLDKEELFPGQARALSGKITELWFNDDATGQTELYISTGQTYKGPCSTDGSRYLVIDLSEPGMDQVFEHALSAFLNEKAIRMIGTARCHRSSKHESLKHLQVLEQ